VCARALNLDNDVRACGADVGEAERCEEVLTLKGRKLRWPTARSESCASLTYSCLRHQFPYPSKAHQCPSSLLGSPRELGVANARLPLPPSLFLHLFVVPSLCECVRVRAYLLHGCSYEAPSRSRQKHKCTRPLQPTVSSVHSMPRRAAADCTYGEPMRFNHGLANKGT
jgi:hypothetical protein